MAVSNGFSYFAAEIFFYTSMTLNYFTYTIGFLALIFGIQQTSVGQIEYHSTQETPAQKLLDFFEKNPPSTASDSLFYQSRKKVTQFTSDEQVKGQISFVKQLIEENIMVQELITLMQYRRNIDSLNQQRLRLIDDYKKHQLLLKMADTNEVTSEDSMFVEIMDAVFVQDTINTDSLLDFLQPYNDTLLHQVDQVIIDFSENEVIQWIRKMRRDTTEFYIVGIDGDSLKIQMYKNNPQIIKFAITDYWGTSIKAIVRDIGTNSFKILVDDTAELEYETQEKAREAFNKMSGEAIFKNQLTISKRPINTQPIFWMYGGNIQFDISQVQLSHSWMKGGQSSISFMAGLELFANYKKENITWENKSVFRYGAIRQGENAFFKPSEDRLELVSKYGHKLFKNYYVTVLGSFKSQFAPGHNYPTDTTKHIVSKFMNPGYLTFAIGLDFKPNPQTTFFISPITSKSTYVTDKYIDETNYGLDQGKKSRHEPGAIIKANYKMKVWDNIDMENTLELFTNYIKNPQNVDLDWEIKFILPVNDFIRATISSRLIYDDDQSVPDKNDNTRTTKAIQYKEMLTIGFGMKF